MTTIQFPNPTTWVDPDRLNVVGEGLLAVVGGALDLYGLGDRYERKYVGHGTEAPVVPSVANQLSVVCPQVYIGRAGEQQYQFVKGEPAKFGFQSAQFMVELAAPWPKQQGGNTSAAIPTPDIAAARTKLWKDGLVMLAALMSLALGGIPVDWLEGTANQIAVGPLTAKDPNGGQAAWVCNAFVEL